MKWGKGRGRGWGGCPEIVVDVTKLYKVMRKVLDKCFQAPILAEINYHGWWLAGSNETKANSAQFQVKWPTGAELGNNEMRINCFILKALNSTIHYIHTYKIDFITSSSYCACTQPNQ